MTSLFVVFRHQPSPDASNFTYTMAFDDNYSAVLSPFLKKFKDAQNEKQKRAVLKNACDAVVKSRDLLEDKTVALPKDLSAVHLFISCLVFCSLIIFLLHFRQYLAISKEV